jgi:hypothetical protein
MSTAEAKETGRRRRAPVTPTGSAPARPGSPPATVPAATAATVPATTATATAATVPATTATATAATVPAATATATAATTPATTGVPGIQLSLVNRARDTLWRRRCVRDSGKCAYDTKAKRTSDCGRADHLLQDHRNPLSCTAASR